VWPYPNFRDLERDHGVSWRDLSALEPKLTELMWLARKKGVACRSWSDVDQVFVPVRDALGELLGLAGKHRAHPVLGGPGAYDVAYWKLYDAAAWLLPGRPGRAAQAGRHAGPALGRPIAFCPFQETKGERR
jgi:hypothetical protein